MILLSVISKTSLLLSTVCALIASQSFRIRVSSHRGSRWCSKHSTWGGPWPSQGTLPRPSTPSPSAYSYRHHCQAGWRDRGRETLVNRRWRKVAIPKEHGGEQCFQVLFFFHLYRITNVVCKQLYLQFSFSSTFSVKWNRDFLVDYVHGGVI